MKKLLIIEKHLKIIQTCKKLSKIKEIFSKKNLSQSIKNSRKKKFFESNNLFNENISLNFRLILLIFFNFFKRFNCFTSFNDLSNIVCSRF